MHTSSLFTTLMCLYISKSSLYLSNLASPHPPNSILHPDLLPVPLFYSLSTALCVTIVLSQMCFIQLPIIATMSKECYTYSINTYLFTHGLVLSLC